MERKIKMKSINNNYTDNNEIWDDKLVLSCFQIFTLIIAVFSFSYIIYSSSGVSAQSAGSGSSGSSSATEDYQGEIGAQEGDFGVVGGAGRARTDISFESGKGLSLSCCVRTSNGAVCQEGVAEGNEAQCPSGWIPARCNQVSECQTGCCSDTETGVCSPQSPKNLCESNGGEWTSDAACSINSCQKNCCLIGDNAYFVTEKECEKLSRERGFQKNYINVPNENSCLILAGLQKKGACVYDVGGSVGGSSGGSAEGNEGERLCSFGTKEECNKIGGVFSESLLCSNPSLNTICAKQARTGCAEGLDEVYWYDSCGNKENIWEGNSETQKDSGWNNGIIKLKGQSCGINDRNGNANSQCGNCDRFSGSRCAVSAGSSGNIQGQAQCRSLNCPKAPATVGTKDRRNGESWCVYESQTGGGKDVPGSQHYLYSCIEGEVISEACSDYRNAVCNEEIIDGQSGKFSEARCRPNMAAECLKYNGIKNQASKAKKCNNNPDCSLKRLDFGKGYKFSVCLPQYPIGFDLTTKDEKKDARGICKQATFECTKVMEKKIGGWECVAGCDCDTQEFTNKMTEWCTSLGDCGPSANTEGKLTTGGYKIANAPKLSAQKTSELKSYSKPKKDKFIGVSNYTLELLERHYGWKWNGGGADSGDSGLGGLTKGITGIGAVGMVAGVMSTQAPASLPFLGVVPASWAPTLSAIGTVAATLAAAAAIGVIVAKVFGLSGQAVIITVVAAVVAAAIYIIVAGCSAGPLGCAVGLLIALIVAIVAAILNKVFGIGDVKETNVKYTCKPWQLPAEGVDCEKCSKDSLQPCTPYKCSTLGTACEYINEGTSEAACINIAPNDNTAPKITPWNEGLSSGYKYEVIDSYNAKLKTTGNECVPEFTQIDVGIKTDEYSQCALSMQPMTNFDEADDYLNEDDTFKLNHTQTIYMPSAESLVYEILGSLQNPQAVDLNLLEQQINEQYNNVNYFIKCGDRAGNSDIKDFVVNTCVKLTPDTTPSAIIKTSPASGSSVAYNTAELKVNFYLNEPAECRWSNVSGQNYGQMLNDMACKTSIQDAGVFGWPCNATLTGFNNSDRDFYVKCRDKPWLKGTAKEGERNNATQDFVYSIKATKSILNITRITPQSISVIYGGVEPFDITLRAETSGGVENGKAECRYSFVQADTSDKIPMLNTFSNAHSQRFDLMLKGNYTIYLECEDIAGNAASAQTSFSLELDTKAPVVNRAANIGGSLTIATDEDSECAYTTNTCDFQFSNANATRMLGVNKVHTTEWVRERTYFVRCQDKYQNPATGCSIIVKAY